MNITKKKTALLASALIVVFVAGVIAGYEVWRYTTQITILEPFEIATTLPPMEELYPGTWEFHINVTNHAGHELNATLYYSFEAPEGYIVDIDPENGTSYTVSANSTVTIPITISINIGEGAPGTVTINWWIERTAA